MSLENNFTTKVNDPLNYLKIDFDASMDSVLTKNRLEGEVITRVINASSTALDKLQFYIQLLVNESSILSAKSFEAISLLAFNKGYKYHIGTAATGLVSVKLSDPLKVEVNIAAGEVLESIKGLKFTTTEAINIQPGDTSTEVNVVQGLFSEKEVITVIDDQRVVKLGKLKLSVKQMTVNVNGLDYSLIESIFDAESGENVYELLNVSDELYLGFGNGSIGSRLVAGDQINVKFLITDGVEGNVKRDEIIKITNKSYQGLTVNNHIDIGGGQDIESVESIRENGQSSNWTQWQITNPESAEAVCKLHPYVEYCQAEFNDGTKTFPYKLLELYVSAEDSPLSNDILDDVKNFITKRVLGDTNILVHNLNIKKVSYDVELTIQLKEVRNNVSYTYNKSDIISEINRLIKEEVKPKNYSPGSTVFNSKIDALIQSVPGVLGVTINDPYDDIELTEHEIPLFNMLYVSKMNEKIS